MSYVTSPLTAAQAAGSGGTFAGSITGGCKGCPGGLSSVGKHYDCDNNGGHDWAPWCLPNTPTNAECPTVGTITSVKYTDPSGGNVVRGEGGAPRDNGRIMCTYSTVNETDMFNTTRIAVFPAGTVSTIKTNFCNAKTFAALSTHTNCKNFYNQTNTDGLNVRYLALINQEKVNSWWTDTAMLATMLSILITGSASGSSRDALTMLTNACLPTNTTWPDNDSLRTFINELIDPLDPAKSNANLRSAAVGYSQAFCRANPASPHCGCWNAAQLQQYAGCRQDANKDLPGCGGLYDLSNTFKTALASSPSLASVITPIENAIKPVCFAAECKACASSSANVNLRTGSTQTCTDNINICLQNVTVRGDMKGTLNQACNINLTAPNTGGIPTTLQTTTNGAGQATVNASSGPDATSSTVSRTVDGKTVNIADLPIKPGQSAFVDKYLPTPEKQKMAIAALLCCCCILILILILGGNAPQQNPMEMQALMLRAQLGL